MNQKTRDFGIETPLKDIKVGDSILLYDGETDNTLRGTVYFTARTSICASMACGTVFTADLKDRIFLVKELRMVEVIQFSPTSETFAIEDIKIGGYLRDPLYADFVSCPTEAQYFNSYSSALSYLECTFSSKFYHNFEVVQIVSAK